MNILAVDTALEACSVALSLKGAGQPFAKSELVVRRHAERLFGMIAEVLDEAGVSITEIDRFAVTIGPGSFTGIRVGIAAVRGFAIVSGVPAVGISTLAAHAEAAREAAGKRPVLAVLPAKGDEVFGQLFAPDGTEITEAKVGDPNHFSDEALVANAVVAGAGSNRVVASDGRSHLEVIHSRSAPDINAVLRVAAVQSPMASPRPLYVKPPDAARVETAVLRL
jgi:tRNA threonylcarbamoyladenosine biosynthesis protein TsaB